MSPLLIESPRSARGFVFTPSRTKAMPEIPVPPYHRPLPPGYWDGLKPATSPDPVTLPKPRRRGVLFGWSIFGALVILSLAWITAKSTSLNQTGYRIASMGAPNPPPAPRAMLTGRYWVEMPDGRRILINYHGSVANFASLPVQPPGGANNAAYTDLATGNTWIWTVPAGASNIAQWIDP